jgi:hypothetical protein
VHDVNHQDSEIAERGAAGAQVRERLVTRGVDDLEARDLQLELESALHARLVVDDGTLGEVSGSDLLSDTAGFAGLYVSSSQFIKNQGFSSVDVAQNTQDRAAQLHCWLLLLQLILLDFLLSGLLLGLKLGNPLFPIELGALALDSLTEDVTSTLFLLLLALLDCSLDLLSVLSSLLFGGHLVVLLLFSEADDLASPLCGAEPPNGAVPITATLDNSVL